MGQAFQRTGCPRGTVGPDRRWGGCRGRLPDFRPGGCLSVCSALRRGGHRQGTAFPRSGGSPVRLESRGHPGCPLATAIPGSRGCRAHLLVTGDSRWAGCRVRPWVTAVLRGGCPGRLRVREIRWSGGCRGRRSATGRWWGGYLDRLWGRVIRWGGCRVRRSVGGCLRRLLGSGIPGLPGCRVRLSGTGWWGGCPGCLWGRVIRWGGCRVRRSVAAVLRGGCLRRLLGSGIPGLPGCRVRPPGTGCRGSGCRWGRPVSPRSGRCPRGCRGRCRGSAGPKWGRRRWVAGCRGCRWGGVPGRWWGFGCWGWAFRRGAGYLGWGCRWALHRGVGSPRWGCRWGIGGWRLALRR
ncbi:hypothetical protein CLV68_6724 [Actinokineospora cianjurensis]|uniref:Uncharacterized protein n=1 Tax=Actinokineospora cianjurensis TaxID=585224 RepID=A0A421AVS1_9PSEU|nr:hypothetical protein CLV68_6724 [Actinokineospora cianjurensis]